jgi:hypothetical protein
MADKKISELNLFPSSITGDDESIIVHNGTDYKFAFSQLLKYISTNILTGSVISFVTASPQNVVGNDGDVTINTSSGKFYQKRSGVWIETLTISANNAGSGGAIIYGLGEPNPANGQATDTYINTANGKFYQKTVNGWNQVFSMLNGPSGGPGPRGATGASGINGRSILNGITNPSNPSVGTDGDFYINTTNYTIFGPKTDGDWGTGVVMVPEDFDSKADITYVDEKNTTLKNYVDTAVQKSAGIKQDEIGAGLTLNADNKLTLDLESKTLVTPSVSVKWTLYKNDGSTEYYIKSSNLKSIIVDKGVKANMLANYKYSAPTISQALPSSASSATFSSILPGPDNISAPLTVDAISSNRTDIITLQKPKSGLLVSGSQVIFASGNDSTSDSCSIAFKGRGFMMTSEKTTLNADDVQEAYNSGSYQDGRTRTFTGVTPGTGKYFYYIYDAAFGQFTSVLYNDAEAYFGAFQFQPGGVTVTNNAGINQNLIVARSNATNAFNNSKIAFS